MVSWHMQRLYYKNIGAFGGLMRLVVMFIHRFYVGDLLVKGRDVTSRPDPF